jgi:hypothetical protein
MLASVAAATLDATPYLTLVASSVPPPYSEPKAAGCHNAREKGRFLHVYPSILPEEECQWNGTRTFERPTTTTVSYLSLKRSPGALRFACRRAALDLILNVAALNHAEAPRSEAYAPIISLS